MATNNAGTSYGELWAIYRRQEQFKDKTARDYQKQILTWMDLEHFLPSLSWKSQLEVLDNCPMPIIKAHASLLHDRTKKALGLEEKEVKQFTSKEWSLFSTSKY